MRFLVKLPASVISKTLMQTAIEMIIQIGSLFLVSQ
jgi:hypothetical protein